VTRLTRRAAVARFGRVLLGALLCLAAAANGPSRADSGSLGTAAIEFLDVGQGDAILIRSPEGKTALVDAGTSSRVVDRLRERGVDQLDMVVVTHHHTDHYGGMDDVIRAFKPRLFVASNSGHTTSMWLKLLTLVRDSGMTAVQPTEEPRLIRLGSVEITVLPMAPEDLKEENNNSVGLRVRHGSVCALMTGDAEETARAWWVANCPELMRDCLVLKLAHHGSHNGTDAELLELVKPKLAVASLGVGNSYGHPHKEALELLEKYRIPLVRTDEMGTIRLRSDGRQLVVEGTDMVFDAGPGAGGDAVLAAREPTSEPSTRVDGAIATASATEPDAVVGTDETKPATGDASTVNINTATTRLLRTLPGVGWFTARRIVRNRPYSRVDELGRVWGMDEARVGALRPYVRVK
jgi:beta-lactamase superfamily II metal-dependent hydrolase